MRFAGKAVVEGAKPLWDPIPIVVNCDSKTRYNVVLDAEGNFDIQARLAANEIVKAKSDLLRANAAALAACKLSAVLDGFESTSVNIVNGAIMDDAAIGTIDQLQDELAADSTVRAPPASAPPDALKEFEKAHSDQTCNHPDSNLAHLFLPSHAETHPACDGRAHSRTALSSQSLFSTPISQKDQQSQRHARHRA